MNDNRMTFKCLRRNLRWMACLMLLACLPLAIGGCYGKFPLTKAVYEFNGQVGAGADEEEVEIFQSIVFWIFLIVPVYKLAMLGDAFIFNLIEFWTGDEIDIDTSVVDPETGTQLALQGGGDTATLRIRESGATTESSIRFERNDDGSIDVLAPGEGLVGHVVQTGNGSLQLMDAEGRVLKTISAERIEAMRAERQTQAEGPY